MNLRAQRIKRRRDGSFKLDLPEDERALLASLPGQLKEVLEHQPDDPALRRLFPPAYPVDPEEEGEYRRLMGDDLSAGHLQALDVLGTTAAESSLTEDQLLVCHLYIGQEAVVVGMQATVIDKDAIITSYRDHGHMLACGMDPKGVMAELTGRASGYSKGKGGSMHMFSREKSFYGGHGIVGAQVPIGTGLAFAHKYNGNKNVSLTYFGDGSANQGQVYEAMNMAALWKLPAVYIIENNRYGMGTSVERASAITELYRHGETFGIPGERIDGMDVVAVKAAGDKAVEHARSGEGPYILEMQTYRYRGHSMSDPAKYRTKEEVDKYRNERDPIEHVRKILLEEKMTDEAALKAVDAEIRKIVNDAAEFAQHSPEPDPSELWTDVLVGA